MKINPTFLGFNYSAKGMGIQKKKMDLISKNLANIDNTKFDDRGPYRRQSLRITSDINRKDPIYGFQQIKLKSTNNTHFEIPSELDATGNKKANTLESVVDDNSQGDKVFMPEHPDADEKGYVQMPNVNIVTEMVDMISATRTYEANLTAFNASKQIIKDSLEI